MMEVRSISDLENEGAVIAIQDGNHGEQHPTAHEYVVNGIPFVMAANIRDGRLDLDACKRLPKTRTDRLRIGFALSGDVLLTHKGTVGEVAVVPTIPWAYVMLTPQVTYYRVNNEKLDRRYLALAFRSPAFQAQLSGQSGQSTRPYIGITAQRNLQIPMFDLDTQHRIASILSAYDDLIENNTRRIAILEEMARRIYEEWFVQFRFPGNEDVKMVESKLGLIPEGWTIHSFGAIATFVNGYAFKPEDWGSNGIPIVKIKELKAGIQADTPRYSETLPEKYRIQDGALLFSWSADLNVYIWASGEGWLNQHLFLVTAKESFIPASFLFHALSASMPMFRSRSNGATMKHIKRSALFEVKTVLPNEGALASFAAIVQPIHDLIISLHRKNWNLRRTRDLLLPKLISGELDISTMPDLSESEAIAA